MSTSTPRLLREAVHAALDLVGDVRDDLHGAAEVVAAALLGDHGVVDAAGGDVAVALHELVDEALVVAQVEVGLGAVFGDEHLAVLEGAHRAGIDVDVGVELLVGDLQAARLEQTPDGGGGDALAKARYDTAGHEDVLRHALQPLLATVTRNVAVADPGTRPCGGTPRPRRGMTGRIQRGRGRARLHFTGRRDCMPGEPWEHRREVYHSRAATPERDGASARPTRRAAPRRRRRQPAATRVAAGARPRQQACRMRARRGVAGRARRACGTARRGAPRRSTSAITVSVTPAAASVILRMAKWRSA